MSKNGTAFRSRPALYLLTGGSRENCINLQFSAQPKSKKCQTETVRNFELRAVTRKKGYEYLAEANMTTTVISDKSTPIGDDER